MELLERSDELAALSDAFAKLRRSGAGVLALVAGEAGIGKTSLVRAFCDRDDPVAWWGRCDPLFTPRPLAPFFDIADRAGPRLVTRIEHAATPGEVYAELVDEVRRREPVVLVIEDLHWADEATLDVIRMLARRIESVPALLVLTFRDDGVDRLPPIRLVLGDLPTGPSLIRLAPAPLSVEAVSALAGPDWVDASALARRTGGNPFFVTEALAAEDAELPTTVRDAVLARAARLGPAGRRLLDAVSIVPSRTELWLLEAFADDYPSGLDECLAAGMLRGDGAGVAFRHEIARAAVEDALPPHERVSLHRSALAALERATEAPADPARLAHHAEGADDGKAVLRYAPEAAERAAAVGAHREAAAQFARALRHAEGLPPARRAELFERRSYECYLTDQIPDAVEARSRALEEHHRCGDRIREGDAHRWLSRLHWFLGDRAAAEREGAQALALLESLPPDRELAMAYSNMSQLRMLAGEFQEAVAWGERALELAEELDAHEIVVHALNNIGTSEYQSGVALGRAKLERSLELALEAGLEEHAARAYTNLGSSALELRAYEAADAFHEAGISFCQEHDLDSWRLYMRGLLSRSRLEQGRWEEAGDLAGSVLRHPNAASPTLIAPLAVLGRLRARRGDPGVWEVLDEALRLARATAELQRLGPVAAARAEARWLAGENDLVAHEAEAVLELAADRGDGWTTGELVAWRRRAGERTAAPRGSAAEPWALELDGHVEAAAERWGALGCPYEAALALASSDEEESLRHALEELQRLGASQAAAQVARTLRRRGVRGVRTGPRASTRANPSGLTARELDVLALVRRGLRNRDIAVQLFVSEKTVDHHVSSILRKLSVETRGQAAAEAERLGIAGR